MDLPVFNLQTTCWVSRNSVGFSVCCFHQLCVYLILSNVKVALWPPFCESCVFSLCIMSIGNSSYFPLWFLERDYCSDCNRPLSLLTFLLLMPLTFLLRVLSAIYLNPYMTNELSHHYYLDESTSTLWGNRSTFFIFISFLDEIHMNKQNSPRWNATFCGVTCGAILFVYVA